MVSVGITGLGSCLPRTIVSNQDLINNGVDTTEEWMLQRTGIKTRRISDKDESLPILMSVAAIRALKDAKLSPLDLDYIIAGTNSTDPLLVPQLASRVQYLIGARNIPSFDVQAGCSGAMYATEMAVRIIRDIYQTDKENLEKKLKNEKSQTDKIIKSKRAKVLVLGGDTLSYVTDIKDKRSSVLLSDGAGAAILEPTYDDNEGIKHIFNAANGSIGNLIHYESGFQSPLSSIDPITLETKVTSPGHFIMNGNSVHKFIGRISSKVIEDIIINSGYSPEILSDTIIIPHQMNLRSIELCISQLEESTGKKPKYVYTDGIINYGNNSTASTLIGLDETYRSKKLDLDDPVIVVAFGAGLTWGGYLTRWNKPKPDSPIVYNSKEEEQLKKELNVKYNVWKENLAK